MMQKDNVVGALDLCANIRKLLSCRRHVIAALFEIAPAPCHSDMALLSVTIDTQFLLFCSYQANHSLNN